MKKCLVALLLVATSTLAFTFGPGFWTQKKRDWAFIQSVGGIQVRVEDQQLMVDCDVSGTREVTTKPTVINSGMGVRKLIHTRKENKIQLTLVTSVIGEGSRTTPKPVDLSSYPAGSYQVVYRDRDGREHDLGSIQLVSPLAEPVQPVK